MPDEIQFVSTNTEEVVSAMVSAYETIIGRSLYPASPERLFIGWCADVIIQMRELINYAANQNVPSRASGENLDAIAELFYSKTRPAAQAAQCTMRFWISAAQSAAVVIPAGTRIADADNTLVWETTEDVSIDAGDLYADVTAECQTVGDTGNGWAVGQITELVDLYSYYDHCQNITESDGGADEANDTEFYTQLRESEDAYPAAGAAGAYIYWAKTASTDIQDVLVIRPVEEYSKDVAVYEHRAFVGGADIDTDSLTVKNGDTVLALDVDYTADYTDELLTITLLDSGSAYSATTLTVSVQKILAGEVWIYGLMTDGSMPSAEMKSKILAACSADDVRPLTDKVSVKDPETVTYDIAVTYYMPRNGDTSAADLAAAVSSAVQEYEAWQSGKLGRDINPSKLISLLMATGVKRVEVTSPAYTVLADGTDHTAPELAVLGTETVISGGFEDD